MVRELLKNAALCLTNSDTPMLDARVLLAKVMGAENAAMIFNMPDEKQIKTFQEYISRRQNGEPVAYILGEKEFMGFTFKLNSDTLIPRPDTECLVEKVIELNPISAPKILDLCTGSGCSGISLAKMIDKSTLELTDISEGALSMAKLNATELLANDKAKVYPLDILNEEICGKYDIITANPPYIEREIAKNLPVSEYEPMRALDGGEDGLTFYKAISKKAFSALNKGGMLALEIGYDQKEKVRSLLTDFSEVLDFKDYGGNDRVIVCFK